MKNKRRFFGAVTSRRDFIKKKLYGGMLLAAGFPYLGMGAGRKSRHNFVELSKLPEPASSIDWVAIRKQFPLLNSIYHFNTASLGPSPRPVIQKVHETIEHLAERGRDRRRQKPSTREIIATFLNVDQEEIAITRNTTEGINIMARSLSLKAGDEVLLTKHEHIGGAMPWLALQKEIGIKIKLIELDLSGENNLQLIRESLSENTKVAFFSHVTCTTGMVLPAREIVALCRKKGIYSCVDGAQAIGMIPLDLADMQPDFYACSGHKWLYGPKGTGILYMSKAMLKTSKPVFVGSNTDRHFDLNTLSLDYKLTADREEYGTRNAPLISGLGAAINFISMIDMYNIKSRTHRLAEHFRVGLADIPSIELLSPKDMNYSTSIVTIRIKRKDNLKLPELLDQEKSIRARGIYENNMNALRFSFSIFNTLEEVDYLLTTLREMVSSQDDR